MHRSTTRLAAVAGALLITTGLVLAGPPLVCHPLDIGSEKSLPWNVSSKNWDGARSDYDLSRLAGDTLELLTPSTPVIVRMETLRRAAIYGMKDGKAAAALRDKLMARARAAEASAKPDALALFDAGYLAETFKQLAWMDRKNPAEGIDGYQLVVKAIRAGGDASMEFAAGLMQKWPNEHSRKARASAPAGSLLAANLSKFD